MKSITIALLLLLITVGGFFSYSYYYQESTIKERENKKSTISVEVEKVKPVVVVKAPEPEPEPVIVVEVPEIIEEIEIKEAEIQTPELVILSEDTSVVVEESLEIIEPIPTKKIAIILSDVSEENIDSAIRYLADFKQVGLAFEYNSYSPMKLAKDTGFDNLIASVIMEPFNEELCLPEKSLKTDNFPLFNQIILMDLIKESYEPIAIMNKMGSKVTSYKHTDVLNPIMKEVKLNKLGFIDSKTNYYSVADKIAKEHNVPFVANDMFLDRDITSDTAIYTTLDKLKAQADKEGYALGITDYSAVMIKALKVWLEKLELDSEYELVSVSSLMK